MQIKTQDNAELAQLAELLEPMKVAMLGNVDERGALVTRPMAPLAMDADGSIWFFTDRRSSKAEHLGMLNLAFVDADRATYVSVSGRGELVDDRARIEQLWTPFAKPWFPDGPQSPNLVLLKVRPDTAEYWDAPNSRMVRLAAMAASVVAGKPIGMGEHDTLTSLSVN